ncbi:JmjC domain, hydroxylase [Geosmithia morbida]|uniref:JmjC domain, hydroxylase n=1 Tax=Geosmithia morbida TaxID=1094350 RepID=A0A9P4YWW7_9HYPO|nr:JmjC domain, hydroxylase [Geosmithia morbida]KAF4123550.1 JmjC domain, hydroxylase [Geosmithia morbida]
MPSAVTTTSHVTGPVTDSKPAVPFPAEHNVQEDDDSAVDSEFIPTHPLGVKPLGNQYFFDGVSARRSIGSWTLLPDEMLTVVLEHLDKSSLLSMGHTCKFFYAFCHSEELWKALFLRYNSSDGATRRVQWTGSWRNTTLGIPDNCRAKVDCGNVFSDVLHRPFACSNINLKQYTSGIPKANSIRRFDNLTYGEFADNWTREPFILSKCIQNWPVATEWTMDTLLRDYGDVPFRAEAVDWTFSTYCKYMRNNMDESPLYLFDRAFAEKMGLTVGRDASEEGKTAAYWRPECFGPDFFELLGQERPAHRWLIVGPERSGSKFHKDPNATSAWNAVISGAKYWIMFPPTAQVPGVYVSRDGGEVTSPLSIAEWLLTFHDEARQLPECLEGICRAGEILHVPSGWWHLVVNTEPGIALTQNFVPQSPSLHHLSEALAFLRDKPDQVSGFRQDVQDPFGILVSRLRQDNPEALEKALDLVDRKSGKKRKWDAVVGAGVVDEDRSGGGGGGFSFGFDGDDVDEEIP